MLLVTDNAVQVCPPSDVVRMGGAVGAELVGSSKPTATQSVAVEHDTPASPSFGGATPACQVAPPSVVYVGVPTPIPTATQVSEVPHETAR